MKKIEYLLTQFLILINRLIPKVKVNKRVLIFVNLGIGDLVMFLPVIKQIDELRYDITFSAEKIRHPGKDILQKFFPNANYDIKGKYGQCILEFHEANKKRNILTIMRLRIPKRIGHSHGKWSKFWNCPIEFDFNRQVHLTYKNLELLQYFFTMDIPYPFTTFFETEEVKNLPEEYICIAPFCYPVPEKEYDFNNLIKKLASEYEIILIGSIEEFYDCENLWINNAGLIYNYAGKLNIFQSAYIIQKSKHFYTHEGGLAHIAVAIGADCTIYYTDMTAKHVLYDRKNIEYIKFYNKWNFL